MAGPDTDLFARWDERSLHFAARSARPVKVFFEIDGANNGWFLEDDNAAFDLSADVSPPGELPIPSERHFLDWGVCVVDLDEHVEGLPWYSRIDVFTFTSDAEDDEERRQVRGWWHVNGATLLWDVRRRNSAAAQASGPR